MSADEIISINIEDKTYNVSKSKLIEKSDYFKALYSSGMKESSEGVVQLQGLSVSGIELIIGFINTSTIQINNETLEDLIETASFLQVTSVLNRILSEVRLDNCVELYKLSDVYGIHDLRIACMKYMTCHFHPVLKRPEFNLLPNSFKQQIRDMRMTGNATLVAIGDFTPTSSELAHQSEPWSMLKYDEVMQRWFPLANTLPTNMINVRGYSSAVLDNYLFIVGGYRMTSQEIAAAHCYNPCKNEWNQIAPMNQKRSNFKLLAVNGKLYAVGGQSLCSVECYSPEADWWSFVASLPDPLAEFSACECKGLIYVMGGYTTRGRNMNILQYCPTLDSWTVFESCEVHIRKQHMLSVEDTIYLVGGYTHEFRPNKRARQNEDVLTVQSYSITTRDWVYLKENTSKSGLNLTCTLHNDGIYIMSRDITTSTSLEHWTSLKYNIFSDMWESFRRFPAFGQNMLLFSLYLPKLL
ncbi:kelch-like protein 42 [Protopterus annectens]|uniref:kelch-like protein 42 n=1 Tax=Protopterus annectens TaxID=7888 RepID=UPI001CFB20C6|nr:kelch-like protein 42 [Protopterus annectens]